MADALTAPAPVRARRRPVVIARPGGGALAGMTHPADGPVGVLIVGGGAQTRHGSHRGFVALADALAAAGHPVLRFDRSGAGDSDGEPAGFRALAPDIAAARAALVTAFPHVRRVIGWGLCDGAAALTLGATAFDALILVNPWTQDGERAGPLPPRTAIAQRYRQRLTDPARWRALLTGGVDLAKAARGLLALMRPAPVPRVARAMAAGLARFPGPVLILLAERDATAQSFAALWRSKLFTPARARVDVIAGATHTFANAGHAAAMAARCVAFAATC